MKEIAMEILRQIGGMRRLELLLGAYNFSFGKNEEGDTWLSFKFKATEHCNYIKITLNWDDLYTVEVGKLHGRFNSEYTVLSETPRVDCDILVDLLEEKTGLIFRLRLVKSA